MLLFLAAYYFETIFSQLSVMSDRFFLLFFILTPLFKWWSGARAGDFCLCVVVYWVLDLASGWAGLGFVLWVSSSETQTAWAHKVPFPLIWILLFLQNSNISGEPWGWSNKGWNHSSADWGEGVFNQRRRGNETLQNILCILSTMWRWAK